MISCRFFHSCSLLKDKNEIVIVGGSKRPIKSECKPVRLNSVEILDVATKTIRTGKL